MLKALLETYRCEIARVQPLHDHDNRIALGSSSLVDSVYL
jgi:hypothetical protein